jgi:hypothetical protein
MVTCITLMIALSFAPINLPLRLHPLGLARSCLSLDPVPCLPDHAHFTSSTGSHPPADLVPQSIWTIARFNLPFNSVPRSARLTASVSVIARLLPIWLSASRPDRHTSARASAHRVQLTYAPLSPDPRAASTSSCRRFGIIAAPLPASRCPVAALSSSPAATAIHVVLFTRVMPRAAVQLYQTAGRSSCP